MDRPNILFITTDEQRGDCLGCYGNPLLRTPNIDSIAASGVRFDRGYVQNPMCMPARMSLMTGRYCSQHGCNINCVGIPEWEQQHTVMQHLADAGYYTAAIGKMHMMPKYGPFGFRYLDLVEGQADRNNQYTDYLAAKGLLELQHKPKGAALPFGVYTNSLPAEENIDAFVARRAVRFLREWRGAEPLFLWVSFSNPHFPFDPPEPYDRMYDPDEVPLPIWREGELDAKPVHRRLRRERGHDKATEPVLRKMVANYYGLISMLDDLVGEVLGAVDEAGLREDTLVAFTSDHGDLLGDHGLLLKSGVTFYESCVRVPYIVSYPRAFPSGVTCRELVESIDLPATFLDVAGARAPETMQGRSLVDAVDVDRAGGGRAGGRTSNWRDDAFSEIDLRMNPEMHAPHDPACRDYVAMIVTERFKYVHFPNLDQGELYDLERDPQETENLFRDPGSSGVLAEMRLRLLNRMMNNQRPFVGERTPSFTEHYESDHRPPGGSLPGVTYAPAEAL